MTLKEQFKQVEICFENQLIPLKYDENGNCADKCEIIADNFAIGFAEWCIQWRVEFIDDTREGILYTYGGMYQKYTMKEILKIYKKQLPL